MTDSPERPSEPTSGQGAPAPQPESSEPVPPPPPSYGPPQVPPPPPVPPTGPPAAPDPGAAGSYPPYPGAEPYSQPYAGQYPPAGQDPAAQYPAQYPAGQYPAPQYAPYPQAPTSSNAVTALVLSIVAWVLCPVIPAIIALVFASKAQTEIDASGGAVGGRGFVTASKIVSWINIGLWAAGILFFLALMIIIAIAGSSADTGSTSFTV